jgi:hypothetical protein
MVSLRFKFVVWQLRGIISYRTTRIVESRAPPHRTNSSRQTTSCPLAGHPQCGAHPRRSPCSHLEAHPCWPPCSRLEAPSCRPLDLVFPAWKLFTAGKLLIPKRQHQGQSPPLPTLLLAASLPCSLLLSPAPLCYESE